MVVLCESKNKIEQIPDSDWIINDESKIRYISGLIYLMPVNNIFTEKQIVVSRLKSFKLPL